MKAKESFLSSACLCLSLGYFQYGLAQVDSSSCNYPDTRYDVHREYDSDGNLIYFDSVAVSTRSYDTSITEIDSLFDIWEYGTPNHLRPYHYGFHFPGDPFGYIPELDFDFIIPDLHDFQEGFEYNYSITPSDSLNSPIFPDDPVYRHQHVIPPSDWEFDIDEQIYRMEKIIEEFNKRLDEQFNKPYHLQPYTTPNDTTESPDINPEPEYNSYPENIINI